MKYIFLIAAILSEVIGSVATRQSSGFSRPWPTAIAIVGVLGAYYLLSLSLKNGMPLGVAYGIWGALGIMVLAVISAFYFKEHLSMVQVLGIILIIGGVLALELGKAKT